LKAREGQEHVVRKSKSTEDQIAFALKQNELRTSVDEVCRKIGISEPTFYVWKRGAGQEGRSARPDRHRARPACRAMNK
jgi:transposase-like protein